MTTTRAQIANHIEDAFDYPPASKGDLLDAATASAAGAPVLAALNTLPERNYAHLRDLWPHLPDVERV